MSLTRIGSIGINTGIAFAGVTTIVTLNTANDALSIGATVNVGSGITLGASGDIFATGITTVSGNVKVGTGITLSPDGDGFYTGVVTATSYYGDGSNLSNITSTTINSNADNRLITGSGTANTLNGESNLTFDGSTLTVNGDASFTTANGNNIVFDKSGNDLVFGDSVYARFGDGEDLALGHDGSNSYISDNGTGDLVINGSVIRLKSANTLEDMLKATENGAVELYHDNSLRLATDANGIHVTTNIHLNDNGVIEVGTGSDLTIQHDGSNTRLKNDTGQLQLRSNAIVFENAAGSSFADIQSHFRMIDSKKIHLGSDTDASIYHDGSNAYVANTTGYLFIQSDSVSLAAKSAGENFLVANKDGSVQLYYDSAKKIETTNSGAAIGQVSTIPLMDSFSCQILAGNSGFIGNYHSGSNQQFILGLNQYYQGGYRAPDNNVSQHLQFYNKKFNFLTAPAPGSDNAVVTNTNILTIDDDGVKFGTDTAAANALDDYEEGTWTPQVHDGSVSVLSANYTKIGRQVTVVARLYSFTDNSTNDAVRIKNLPFNAAVHDVAAGSVMYSYGGNSHYTTLYMNSSNQLNIYGGHSGAFDQLRHNELNVSSGTTDMYIIATYFAAT